MLAGGLVLRFREIAVHAVGILAGRVPGPFECFFRVACGLVGRGDLLGCGEPLLSGRLLLDELRVGPDGCRVVVPFEGLISQGV